MLTLRAVATLLEKADALASLEPIASVIGCTQQSAPLDSATLLSLGIGDVVDNARIAAGPGALRALMVELRATSGMRELVPRIAARLATRAPHVLWVVIAIQRETTDVAIAAWTGERRPPRVSALIADRTQIIDSDAETLRALASVSASKGPVRDLLVHSRWTEVLGREALSIRFYRALERSVSAMATSSARGNEDVRAELALLNSSRLLFLAFLEAKGWLDGNVGFLAQHYENCVSRGGGFHARVLRPLFFGTLNTPLRKRARAARSFGRIPFLNGGLFSRTPLERRHRDVVFDDDAFGALLYDVFGRFRFTAREEGTTWSEAAVDPEMLGRAFESLMASRERRNTGAFYTPFSLVEHVTERGMEALSLDGRVELERLTVLDPACGSGAFLVYALERIARRLAEAGDERDMSAIRRDVLTRSIFGVDINPTAVWLCELRLWLSVIIECDVRDPMAIEPLPNLDRNIRVGDSLAGGSLLLQPVARTANIRTLRERYSRATGGRKETLGRALDRVERSAVIGKLDDELKVIAAKRRDLLDARRGRDLFGDAYRPTLPEKHAAAALRRRASELRAARRRVVAGGALPFSFATHFADVATRGGFSLVVGNPPWIRLHRIPAEQRIAMRREFDVARYGGWEHGANVAGAGRGFAAQIDAAALFIERASKLLAPTGALTLLVPAKLWRSLAGGGVRRLLTNEMHLRRVDDFSEGAATFDAAVYPSLVVASRAGPISNDVEIAVHHRGQTPFTWCAPKSRIAFDDSLGAPWLLLPPQSRRAFDWLLENGTPLAESSIGRPRLGVKCGCNDAFLVDIVRRGDELSDVRTNEGRTISVETSMLRPLVRGESARAWSVESSCNAILWTHDLLDVPMRTLPPNASRWFTRWRHTLMQRADARGGSRWWSLFRTDAARSDAPRVVWGDVGRSPRAFVLDKGDPRVPLNTCYVVRCSDDTDAHAIAMLLNSPVARAWLNALAEPARGGYRRYMGWTLALLPLPHDWSNCREALADIGRRARLGQAPRDTELFDATLLAYGAAHFDLAPLVAWDAP